MRTRLQKWGNSLAVRIPKPLAADLRLEEDSPVDLSEVDGVLVVTPVVEPEEALEALLEGITQSNIHEEVETGAPVGREVW